MINELLNRIATLKEALEQLDEGRDNSLAAQENAPRLFSDNPKSAEECNGQIELLRNEARELRKARVTLKNRQETNLESEARAGLEKQITEILAEINTALINLQTKKRDLLTNECAEGIKSAFQELQVAQQNESKARHAKSNYMERYYTSMQKLDSYVSARFAKILANAQVSVADTANDKYTAALEALGLLKDGSHDKYSNALEVLGLPDETEGSDKYTYALERLDLRATEGQKKYHALTTLAAQIERRVFLLEAQQELKQYQQVLKNQDRIYIPTDKIPKDKLKIYLERNDGFEAFNNWLDEYYSRARATEDSSWGWLKEQFKYRTTVLSPAESDEDWDYLADLIDSQLNQISEELKDQLAGVPISAASPNAQVEDGLYTLQQRYQLVNKLKALENLENLEQIETKTVTKLNDDRLSFTQKAAKAKLSRELAEISHLQAMLKNNLVELKTKYIGILDKVEKDLNAITHSYELQDDKTDLAKAKQALGAINTESMLAQSSHYRDLSCNNLEQNINNQSAARERNWNLFLKEVTEEFTEVPEDLQAFMQEVEKQFTAHNKQKLELQEKKGQLKKIISALQSFTSIQLELSSVQEQLATLKADNSKARQELFSKIDEIKARLEDVALKEKVTLKYSSVKAKFEQANTLMTAVQQAKTSYQLQLLTGAETVVSTLTEQAKQLSLMSNEERANFPVKVAGDLGAVRELMQTTCTDTDKIAVQNKKRIIERESQKFKQVEEVIPLLNELETISSDYSKLIARSENLSDAEHNQLTERIQLGHDLQQLNKASKTPIAQAKNLAKNTVFAPIFNPVIIEMEKAQHDLNELRSGWAGDAQRQPIIYLKQLTHEVELGYENLINHYCQLPPLDSKKQFYKQPNRTSFYESLVAFEQCILQEKLKLWKSRSIVQEGLSIDSENTNTIRESEQKIADYKSKLQEFILAEVKAGYETLYAKCRQYSHDKYSFYARDKRQLQQDIVAFKESALFRAYEAIGTTSPNFNALYERQFSLLQVPQKADELSYVREQACNKTNYRYFGTDNILGKFDLYLKQRHQAFWFKDFIGSIAAGVLGCFGFKSEQSQREEYINDLHQAYQSYQSDVSNYDGLIELINKGISEFKSRVQHGEDNYDKTLQSYLEKFKSKVQTIHAQNTLAVEEEREEIQVGM
ncbi:Uncharacterised protein [Legionella beliardensis]|uniref:Uncharacterized protein n=1 Tax=Legionella beliardensis TaxID=91822 RepID=A0A378HZV3_9GAMM|nr:hypothetical protein [Legionella beliardensis]STX27990.1 Uncharacterised protein [Legionella beliardensis]